MDQSPLDAHVVALTHYLPPYMARVLYHVSPQVRDFRILLSIQQEPNRQFGNTWDGLKVTVQNSWMLRRNWKHKAGFADELYVHVPHDTLSQLKRLRPDIVFSYELGFRSLASMWHCRRFGAKLALCVCVSEHTERGRGMHRHLLRKLLLRSADAVTYNGPSCRRYLEGFGVPSEKLFHFPYASSDLFYYTGPLERSVQDNHRLLYVGQLSERKGVLPMLQQIIDYCHGRPGQRVELDVVGNGPLESEIRSLTLPGNLHLHMHGHQDYDQISQLMERTGIMIFPTLADEWGLVTNEAMQAGMPVLGSRYAQSCETLIEHGRNGWVYTPDQPRELHRVLDEVYQTPDDQLQQMRSHAQATVAGITSQASADKAVAMFRQLMGCDV